MSENKDIEAFDEAEIYTLVDENGEETEFELIAECELEGSRYFAMCPVDDEDSGDENDVFEYVILKVMTENGEETLVSIDDDDEFDEVADYFDDLLSSEVDYDA